MKLADMNALLEKATPGPWYALEPFGLSRTDHGYRMVCDIARKGKRTIVYCEAARIWKDGEGYRLLEGDAEAIAALRTAAPALIACAEALRNGIDCGQIVGESKTQAIAALRALESV